MGLKALIQVALFFAMLGISTGRLPAMLKAVRVAQLHLIEDSKASKWGQVVLP